MKTFHIAYGLLMGLALIAPAPAQALTLGQVFAQEGGAHCSGNVCVHNSVQSGGVSVVVTGSSEGPSPSVCGGQVGYWANPAPGICVIDMKASPSSWSNVDTRNCSTQSDTIGFDPRKGFDGWSISSHTTSTAGAC